MRALHEGRRLLVQRLVPLRVLAGRELLVDGAGRVQVGDVAQRVLVGGLVVVVLSLRIVVHAEHHEERPPPVAERHVRDAVRIELLELLQHVGELLAGRGHLDAMLGEDVAPVDDRVLDVLVPAAQRGRHEVVAVRRAGPGQERVEVELVPFDGVDEVGPVLFQPAQPHQQPFLAELQRQVARQPGGEIGHVVGGGHQRVVLGNVVLREQPRLQAHAGDLLQLGEHRFLEGLFEAVADDRVGHGLCDGRSRQQRQQRRDRQQSSEYRCHRFSL